MGDIIYAVSSSRKPKEKHHESPVVPNLNKLSEKHKFVLEGVSGKRFRLSRPMYNHWTGHTRYQMLMKKLKDAKPEVAEMEQRLIGSKSLDLGIFINYLVLLRDVRQGLSDFYSKTLTTNDPTKVP
jgi:hypothetical protein